MNQTLVGALRPEVREALHPDIIERLNKIDKTDFSMVFYKTKKELAKRGIDSSDERVNTLIFALKQYYAVALLDPLNGHAVSILVDDPWHMHVLDTKAYAAFCNEIFGNVLPHVHLNFGNTVQVSEIRTLYSYTVEMLGKMFSHVSAEMYPSPEGAPDEEVLICYHYRVEDPAIQSHALFPLDVRGRLIALA